MVYLAAQPILDAQAAAAAQLVICDRSLLDHWAYTTYLFGDQLRAEGVLRPLTDLVKIYCRLYSRVFYVPIEFPAVDDGTRESDPEFQAGIAHEIEAHMIHFDIHAVRVTGSIGERVSIVLRHLAWQ